MKKILIAEDDKGLSEILVDRFKEDGWDVKVAFDGEEAISEIKKNKFDLVLLDLLMPKKTGFEVLDIIKSDPTYEQLPIIVLSSLGSDEDIKRALKAGATDYFVKTQHPVGEILEKAKKYE